MREVARLNFEGKLQAVAEEKDEHVQTMDFAGWKAVVSYGVRPFGPGSDPQGNPEAAGRALVAQVGADDFLVAGYSCRVDFHPSDPSSKAQREFIRVEEGTYDGGVFRPARIWNGDQTDWGLNFGSVPVVLRARIGTF